MLLYHCTAIRHGPFSQFDNLESSTLLERIAKHVAWNYNVGDYDGI